MPQNLWIARHGHRLDFAHPEWFNTAERRYDPPLSEEGHLQAQHLAQRLQAEAIAHIFCSPFLRAIQTAHPVAVVLGLPLKLEAGLGEWHNLDWMSETPQTHPRHLLEKTYCCLDWDYKSQISPHYPESTAQLQQRITATVKQLITVYAGNILLVGHSVTVIEATTVLVKNLPAFKAPLGCLVKLVEEGDRWHPELLGDTSHLIPPEATFRDSEFHKLD